MGKLASGVSFSALGGTSRYATSSSGGTKLRRRGPYSSSSHPQRGRRGSGVTEHPRRFMYHVEDCHKCFVVLRM